MKTRTKKVLWICLIFLVVGLVGFGGVAFWLYVPYPKDNRALVQSALQPLADLPAQADKIHFLNTGNSDAILLESDGHFALIDAAEDTDNPKNTESLALAGYEEYVLDYVKRVTGGHLDFVLGTHCHSDHIGGFDTLLADPEITVDTVFLKRYNPEGKNSTERGWDNEEVYAQMVEATNQRGFKLVQDLPDDSFKLGNMDVTFYNTADRKAISGGENDNSVATLVRVNGRSALLAADMNNWSGDERRTYKEIGSTVDLVKAGHHSHAGSGSVWFGRGLLPQYLVVTGKKAHWLNLVNYAVFARSTVFISGETGGTVVTLDADALHFYQIGAFQTSKDSR
ncbi:MAG: MBL fold metallo-hydrolase [Oscillospiraceae bacterium]|nr:MBL fold metallo-hydrolase [Oscillospiraceae bacterium]